MIDPEELDCDEDVDCDEDGDCAHCNQSHDCWDALIIKKKEPLLEAPRTEGPAIGGMPEEDRR